MNFLTRAAYTLVPIAFCYLVGYAVGKCIFALITILGGFNGGQKI